MPDDLMPKNQYDLIILGGGSAGIVSGVTAGALGLRVLLIEKHRMGGECLNTGCVPSKALIHSARVAALMRRGEDFGLRSCSLSRADAAGVLAHVREMIGVVRTADATEQLLKDYGVAIRIGDAQFSGPDSLELEGEALRADHFILATGSRPARPPIRGLEEAGYRTNEEIFDLDEPPESLLVVGGGPIGVELAQAFGRLGSRVTLVEMLDRLLPHDDLELARALEAVLKDEGMEILLESSLQEVRRAGSRKEVVVKEPAGTRTLEVDEILVAVGRKPNVEGLNLEAAGVRLEKGGVVVDAALHTTGPHVWACGDVIGRDQFSHIAEVEAKLVVQNLFLPVRQKLDRRVVPWATFTDPELAHVGVTEEQARRQGMQFEVYRQPFSQDDRALVEGEGTGLVKILATRWTGKILGASILGPRAGELIQEFVLAMRYGLSIRQVADAVHVYPTLTVACQRAAQRWYEARGREPAVEGLLSAYRRLRAGDPAAVGAALGIGAAMVGVAGLVGWSRRHWKNKGTE